MTYDVDIQCENVLRCTIFSTFMPTLAFTRDDFDDAHFTILLAIIYSVKLYKTCYPLLDSLLSYSPLCNAA